LKAQNEEAAKELAIAKRQAKKAKVGMLSLSLVILADTVINSTIQTHRAQSLRSSRRKRQLLQL
jgi:hypothetical protein